MAARQFHPDELKDAFELYILHNGQRFDLVEKEMHRRGWTSFKRACIKSKGFGKNRREGLAEKHGWDDALKIHIATIGTLAATSAESLLHEVEFVRKKIYLKLQSCDVGPAAANLIAQHDKYVARSTEILDRLNSARDNYGNSVFFFKWLMKRAATINPELAKVLCESEEALMDALESDFVTADDAEDPQQ